MHMPAYGTMYRIEKISFGPEKSEMRPSGNGPEVAYAPGIVLVNCSAQSIGMPLGLPIIEFRRQCFSRRPIVP